MRPLVLSKAIGLSLVTLSQVRTCSIAVCLSLTSHSWFPSYRISLFCVCVCRTSYTWTYHDGQTQNQIDHILIDRRWHLKMLNVQRFRGAECDTDHCVVVAKVRKRLTVSKQTTLKFDVERFISGRQMNWSLGKSIRLRFQTG